MWASPSTGTLHTSITRSNTRMNDAAPTEAQAAAEREGETGALTVAAEEKVQHVSVAAGIHLAVRQVDSMTDTTTLANNASSANVHLRHATQTTRPRRVGCRASQSGDGATG